MKQALMKGYLALILFLLYAPVLILMVYSFTDSTMIGSVHGFSLQNYRVLFQREELIHMIVGTLVLAAIVAVLSGILGTLGAVGAFYASPKRRRAMDLMNQIPVINADVVTGFSICVLMIVFFHMSKDTYLPLILGLTSLCTPFVYLSVMPRLQQLDPQIFEAALDLGCTPMQTMYRVVLPQLVPGITSGMMLSVTLVMDDYFITTYTKPATFDTISTYVVNATKGAQTEIKTALWALSTVIFVCVLLIVAGNNIVVGRRKHIQGKKRRHRTASWMAVIVLCVAASLGTTGCGKTSADGLVLRVANWEEYIDETMVDEFETWYEDSYGQKVTVEYSTFGTNEDLYNQMSIGDTFDLICPSEYMMMKLLGEGKLLAYSEDFFDAGNEDSTYAQCVSPYIEQRLQSFQVSGSFIGDYVAGYMWGTLGYVYNPEVIPKEDTRSWDLLLNKKYKKRITTKDSIRDCYFAAMGMITADEVSSADFISQPDYEEKLSGKLNDTSDENIDKVRDILTQVKENVYSFETDSGKSDLVSGKVVANLQWSGDAVYSMAQAEEDGVTLQYAVPEESTNLWFDGWCMLKDGIAGSSEKKQAAEAFVNYLSRPENAVRNMDYIGYTSVISGGNDDSVYEYIQECYGEENGDTEYDLGYFFGDDSHVLKTTAAQAEGQLFAQYPTEEVIHRSVVMACFDNIVNQKINRMWIDIRCWKP